ncbi:hypothetical protein HanOQP8_Chr13g0476521 [Helianthus annuus]|nr:hypothetical protein HanOQP8_Chr13g0476521 [Helianthus annuus]
MDQSQISCRPAGDRIPPLSGKHVWLVAQTLEAEDMIGDQIFFSIHDPLSQYRCRVPELVGRRIRGCFHGWVIMSNHPYNVMWSLWNPLTSKLTRLPPLNHEDGDISECCLPSPPDDPGSILLLTRKVKPTFVFCRLDRKRKRLRWTEMSYAKQLKNITGEDGSVHSLTCCNGKLYALNTDGDDFLIEVHIVVKAREVVISLLPFVKLPSDNHVSGPYNSYFGPFLKGTCSGLFFVILYFKWKLVCSVRLVKLDMTRKLLEEMEDLDDGICFLDFDCYNVPVIPSELGGGYIHMLCEEDKATHSYNVKDKTLALSSMPRLDLPPPTSGESRTSYVSVWSIPECRLKGDHGEINHMVDSKHEEDKEEDVTTAVEVNSMANQHDESYLFNIPFHVLEMIMEFCVDIDYVNFRATCKQLTAPVTRWSNRASITRLRRYSLVSPWLMVLDKDQGVITFTDPMFGDQYSIRSPTELKGDLQIWCSMYGWLLMSKGTESMMLFNPFTGDIRKLPNLEVDFLDSFCLSTPPTSPDCMVVGFGGCVVFVHFIAREPATWLRLGLEFDGDAPSFFRFSTSCGQDLYALSSEGQLSVFTNICKEDYSWVDVEIASTSCCRTLAQYFLAKHDQDILLVIVEEFGESVELFKLNLYTKKWEKIDGLGKHMIYICGTTCLCIEAKIPEMENKIFFALLHSKNGKIVFYSLDTCRYHTFSGKSVVESLGSFFGTKQYLHPHAWIEPNYS